MNTQTYVQTEAFVKTCFAQGLSEKEAAVLLDMQLAGCSKAAAQAAPAVAKAPKAVAQPPGAIAPTAPVVAGQGPVAHSSAAASSMPVVKTSMLEWYRNRIKE